jgi:HK97 family phage prohead protease
MTRAPIASPEAAAKAPPFTFAAQFRAETADKAARTVEIVLHTGAPVQRVNWWSGDEYEMQLVMTPEAADLGRMNAGANLLNSHDASSLNGILGSFVDGSVKFTDGQLVGRAKFSHRAGVQDIIQDVADGIIRHASIGFRIKSRTITERENAPDLHTITKWEPYEASLVAVPADAGAQVRQAYEAWGERFAMTTSAVPTAPTAPAAAPMDDALAAARAEGRETERKLQVGRTTALRRAALLHLAATDTQTLEAFASTHSPEEITAEAFRLRQVFEDRGGSSDGQAIPTHGPNRSASIAAGQTEPEKRAGAIEAALLHRYDPAKHKLGDGHREFVGLSLVELARDYMTRQGRDMRGKGRGEVAREVFAGSAHATGDFPFILANVANKTLRMGYDESPRTFVPFCRQTNLADFKIVSRTLLGEAPTLTLKAPGMEITEGTLSETREQWSLKTYAKAFSIDREAIVNDDLDAFSRIPALFGAAAARMESDVVWAVITTGDTTAMGDGGFLFRAANTASAASPSSTSLMDMRRVIRLAKGVDGTTLLNLMPSFIIAPEALYGAIEQLFSGAYVPTGATTAMTAQLLALQRIYEPRLDADSATKWYMSAAPSQIDTVEYGYLAESPGPQTMTEMDFGVGMTVKVFEDFGAKAIDFRGFAYNVGA